MTILCSSSSCRFVFYDWANFEDCRWAKYRDFND